MKTNNVQECIDDLIEEIVSLEDEIKFTERSSTSKQAENE